MENYNISITQADLPYIVEAIGLRAITIQESIRMQVKALEEQQRRKDEEAKRAAMPDPFALDTIITSSDIDISAPTFDEVVRDSTVAAKKQPSRKQKRATLMRILKGKGAADLTTAEISRRAGVSYVTAAKARKAFAPKKGRK